MDNLSRPIQPAGRPQDYQTYQILAPVKTHFRPAKSCAEIDCPNYINGWKTIVPANSDHVDFIRSLKGRFNFTEEKVDGGLICFTFPPGQDCFQKEVHGQDHMIRLDREEKYVKKTGDHRASSGAVVLRSDQWQEDFAENRNKIAAIIEKG